jgi:hypothetical protein
MCNVIVMFILHVKALHVSGGFSAHHQELRNCTHSIGYCQAILLPTASVGELELTHASGRQHGCTDPQISKTCRDLTSKINIIIRLNLVGCC